MLVYKITNKINGKAYIGQTRGSLRVRWLQHIKLRSKCSALKNALKKYGVDNFVIEEIALAINEDQLAELESKYIKEFNTLSPAGYNLTTGGEGARHSEESIRKLSESKLGAKNPSFGKKQSEETKAKRSAALKGRKRPQWVKDKIRASHNPISDKNLTYRRTPKSSDVPISHILSQLGQ